MIATAVTGSFTVEEAGVSPGHSGVGVDVGAAGGRLKTVFDRSMLYRCICSVNVDKFSLLMMILLYTLVNSLFLSQ